MEIKGLMAAVVLVSATFSAASFSQALPSPVDSPAVFVVDGMDRIKARREAYKSVDGEQLFFDLYQPTDLKQDERRGTVVFANWKGRSRTEWALMISWGKIVAASGLNAVVYQSATDPDNDLRDVIEHLRKHGAQLAIDENRFGIFTTSGNTVAAVPYMTEAARPYVRCGVIYYGMVSAVQDPTRPPVRQELPLMIVRSGLESSVDLNRRLDDYIARLESPRLH